MLSAVCPFRIARCAVSWLGGMILAIAVATAQAQQKPLPLPEMVVARCAVPPKIDGKIKPGEWDNAPACTGFVMTNNVAPHNNYGIMGQDRGPGADTINVFFPSAVIRRNVIAGQTGAGGSLSGYPFYYPSDNFYPTTLNAVGFTDSAGGDYNLAATSAYKGQATDGKDVGINQLALEEAADLLLTQP